MMDDRCAGDKRPHTFDSLGACERCGKASPLPTSEQLDWVELPGLPGQYLPRVEYERAQKPRTTHQRAIAEYEQLTVAAAARSPECMGDDRYITDDLPIRTRAELMQTCARCQLRDLCDAYAAKARPLGGIWSGKTYTPPGQCTEKGTS